MTSYTMRPFDYNKAQKAAETTVLPLKVGTVVTVDDKQTYRITEIKPKKDEGCYNYYVLCAVGDTLKEEQRQHNMMAKKNPSLMTVGKHPDFSFEVDALWFFSRNVKW